MNHCICEQCKYFVQHYEMESGVPRKVFAGHCLKLQKACKPSITNTRCQNFEIKDINLKLAGRHKFIIDTLTELSNQIKHLISILEKDLCN